MDENLRKTVVIVSVIFALCIWTMACAMTVYFPTASKITMAISGIWMLLFCVANSKRRSRC